MNSAAVDEPIDAVLGRYPVNVLDTRSENYKVKKGVWWVRTAEGLKILKKVSYSEETLRFILQATAHLSGNGIRLPEVNKTSDGSDYVNHGGSIFVMMDAVEGRNPSYGVPGEMDLVARELARFHKASGGFFPAPDTKPKYHLGLWVEDYQDQLEDINGFYKKELARTDSDPAGKAVTVEFPYFYERALKAITALRGPGYSGWVKKAEREGCLCHQDFAAGNLIITRSGAVYVLDTDSITIDIPARDIRKLLNKVMKKEGRWDAGLTARILKSYQEQNPLAPSEWEVVKLDLMFPHLFIGAVNKYYYQRDKDWSQEKYLQRIVEISAFEKTIHPVLDRFDRLIPC